MAGSIDQHLPMSVGRLNRHHAPANAVIFQTCVACIFATLVFIAAPYIFKIGQPANLSPEFFDISLALVSVVWALITIFFIAIGSMYATSEAAWQSVANTE